MTRRLDQFLRLRPTALAGFALTAIALAIPPAAEAGAWLKRAAVRQTADSTARPTLAQARESFMAQRYAEAYGRFAELADRGDATAAWMALTMVTNGPAVFGAEWSATPGQLRRWTALAVTQVERRGAVLAAHDRGE